MNFSKGSPPAVPMFREVKSVRQVAGEPHKRFFRADGADLFVWTDDRGELLEFQFAFDFRFEEVAARWRRGGTTSLVEVETGQIVSNSAQLRSPMYLPTDTPREIAIEAKTRFDEHAGSLDENLRSEIGDHIEEAVAAFA